MSEFDLSILNDRINSQKRELGFYKDAIEMLINQYDINGLFEGDELYEKYDYVPKEFIASIINSEVPSDDLILRVEDGALDDFVQDALFIVGFVIGINDLERETNDTSDYVQFLYDCRKEEHLVPVGYSFAALSLAMNRAPSVDMMMRFFPPTEDLKTNIQTFDLITEMNGDLVVKYKRLRDLK